MSAAVKKYINFQDVFADGGQDVRQFSHRTKCENSHGDVKVYYDFVKFDSNFVGMGPYERFVDIVARFEVE